MTKIIGIIFIFLSMQSCFNYSALDGSIDAESFSITLFEEQAPNSPVGYGAQLTEFLKDFVIGRSSMKLVNNNADLQISGRVTGYRVLPIAVQANETAATNRLTITILVSVINNKNEDDSFEQVFSQFSDFPSSSDLSSVESELLADINAKLGQDLINKLTSNW